MNALRSHAIGINSGYLNNHSVTLHTDLSTYATAKGADGVTIVGVFSNQGTKGGAYELALAGGYAPGTNVTEVFSCKTQAANNVGNITVQMNMGMPNVFFPTVNMNGSGLCGYTSDGTTNETSPSATASSTGSSASSTGSAHHSAGDRTQMHLPTFAVCILLGFAVFLL